MGSEMCIRDSYTHTLQLSDGRLQIVEKRVDLIDSSEAFEPIEVFI